MIITLSSEKFNFGLGLLGTLSNVFQRFIYCVSASPLTTSLRSSMVEQRSVDFKDCRSKRGEGKKELGSLFLGNFFLLHRFVFIKI